MKRITIGLALTTLSLGTLLNASCGDDTEGTETGLGSCPTDSGAQESAGKDIVKKQCENCHSSALAGGARNAAPTGVDFDKLDYVRANAAKMYEEIEEGEMPPGAALSASAQESVRVWLACGARDVEGPDDLGTCPANSTAQETAGRAVIRAKCESCHGSTKTGADRFGAPTGYDVDNLDFVRTNNRLIFKEIKEGNMPPAGGALPAQEQESVRVWLVCGAKDL